MSRIGKLPIPVPDGVEVSIDGSAVVVKGPKGELSQEFEGLVEHHTMLHHVRLAAMQIGAVSEDHAGLGVIDVITQVACVRKRVAR